VPCGVYFLEEKKKKKKLKNKRKKISVIISAELAKWLAR
jgi:hypothetical protein